MAVVVQVLSSIIVCFPCLNLGIVGTLPSSTIADFVSPNTTLNRPMTEMEVNLYGSLAPLGGLVSTPFVSLLLDRLGRKYCTMFAGLAGVLSWAILACTNRIELVLTAVFIGGVGGISFLIVPAYLSEICQESIRGTMTAGSMMFYGIGTLVSYILGGYLEYMTMVYVGLALAIGQLMTMSWLKESPTLLLKNGQEELAAQSVAFYRQVLLNSKIVTQELSNIRRYLKPEESELIPVNENSENKESKNTISDDIGVDNVPKNFSLWKYFKNSASARRGSLIALVLVSASILQGLVVLQVYAEPVIVMAAIDMTVSTCTLVFAIAIVVASVLGAYLSDIVGRRPLMIYSSIAAGVCCVLLGTQMQLHWAPGWATAGLLYLFAVVFSFGGGTVPFVVLSEMFQPEVKSFMTMVAVEWMWLCYFFSLLVFFPLSDLVGLGGVFYIFAAICFLTAVYSVFYVPETKGRTLNEVQLMLIEKRNY